MKPYNFYTVPNELPTSKPSIFTQTKRFTYSEVVALTNNFERVIGEGGFGVVYYGSLNDTKPVAVKVLSQSSIQGYKEFKAEVCQFIDNFKLGLYINLNTYERLNYM